MKAYPHLITGLAVIFVSAIFLTGGLIYAHGLEDQYIHTLASQVELHQRNFGEALQKTTLQQNDLLLLAGSSELFVEITPINDAAFHIFRTYPTGFMVDEMALLNITSLNISQDFAALGPELGGKKVVFSFTPRMFTAPEVGTAPYAGDFSNLHALELVYSPYLTEDLKIRAAKRMLMYPDTLKKDGVLLFGLETLAGDSPVDRLLYGLAFPIGWLDIGITRLQDHWEVLNYIWGNPKLAQKVTNKPQTIDWTALISQAEIEQKKVSASNPYGVNDSVWTQLYSKSKILKSGSGDAKFLDEIKKSQEWIDFDIALETLKQMGADPLILCRPFNGPLWEAIMGVSSSARQEFYAMLEQEVQKYGMKLVDFKEYDTDPYFGYDISSHMSPKGWLIVDETLDNFFHNRIN